MKTETYNENIDFFYKMQKDETEHQNRRMLWGLTTQALLFAGFSQLTEKAYHNPQMTRILVFILMVVGICVSISAVYSMVVGDLSFSRIFAASNVYEENKDDVKHWVMTAPKAVLESRLSFLSLYSFVPRVFCAAWLTMPFSFFLLKNGLEFKWYYVTTILFIFFLLLIILISHCFFECQKKKIK